MKKLIKTTWRHFAVALILQILITWRWSYLAENLYLIEQCVLAFVAWVVLNWGFEIRQRSRGGKNTFEEMLYDCISAGLGGAVGVLIVNIF